LANLSIEDQKFVATVVTVARTALAVSMVLLFLALASVAGNCGRIADALERAHQQTKNDK